MAKKPKDRWADYDEFIMALTAARSQLLIRQLTGRTPDLVAPALNEAPLETGARRVVGGDARRFFN